MRASVVHIVVGAGRGTRFGGEPKQYRLLGGEPVMIHAVRRLLMAAPGSRVVAVVAPGLEERFMQMAREAGLPEGSLAVTAGGDVRWQSVRNALRLAEGADVVTVHDAARPLVDAAVVSRLLQAVGQGAKAVVPAVAVTDSLRLMEGGSGVSRAVDRAAYRAVQTPQAFCGEALRAAYSRPYSEAFTDDASVMEAAGHAVELVEGSPSIFKITHAPDLARAEWMLAEERRQRRLVFLLGMPASGKTTLGRAVARQLGRPFIDLDEAVAARAGMPIAQIITSQGEAAFRSLETQTLREVAEGTGPAAIVAVGGGTPCFGPNMDMMLATGLTVRLEASADTLVRRLREGGDSRPLAASAPDLEAYVADTLKTRGPHYARAALSFQSDLLESPAQVEASVRAFIALTGLQLFDYDQ